MRLAIVVGHTARSPGANSPHLGTHEYHWNVGLALRILAQGGEEVGLFRRDGHGVPGAYAQAREWGAEAVVELHFNSHSDPRANGTETLFVTPDSQRLAQAVQRRMVAALGLRDRGAKAPWEGRGQASLTALPIPSVIVEPFFGSNAADAQRAQERREALAAAILQGAREALS